MIAELLESHDLEDLLEGAETAGQGHERIAPRVHDGLAVAQAFGDHELGHRGLPHPELDQGLGYDADHLAAGTEHRAGQGSHQAQPAPSIDEPPSTPREFFAQLAGRLEVLGVHPVAGAAENGDGADQFGSRRGAPPRARPALPSAISALRRMPGAFGRVSGVPAKRVRNASSSMLATAAAPG